MYSSRVIYSKQQLGRGSGVKILNTVVLFYTDVIMLIGFSVPLQGFQPHPEVPEAKKLFSY